MPVHPSRLVWLVAVISWVVPAIESLGEQPRVGQDGPVAESVAGPREELEREVQRLIEELGAETRAARARAEHELLQLGAAALPHLPPPDLLPDVSVREAVRRVRLTLERRKAQESVRPSRVTLSGRFPLQEILERVSQQTQNRIELESVPEAQRQRVFEVDFDGDAFWKVFDDQARQADLRISGGEESQSIALVPRSDDSPPHSLKVLYSGPARLAVLSAETRRLPGDDRDLLRVRLGLMVEPRLRPLFLKLDARNIAAAILEGGMLKPFNPEASYEIPMNEGSGEVRVQLDYYAPPGPVQKVSLQGRMTMLVAAGAEKIAFAAPAGSVGVAKRRGGVTVSLEKAAFR